MLSIQQAPITHIYSSKFCGNIAKSYGGTLFVRDPTYSLTVANFVENSATQGAVMHLIEQSTIVLTEDVFEGGSMEDHHAYY